MPNTYAGTAISAIERLRGSGFGARPDGSPLTASIGVSERIADSAGEWRTMVEIADKRMYAAKQSGKNRIIGPAGSVAVVDRRALAG
jgi:PleD family two-component response regulator